MDTERLAQRGWSVTALDIATTAVDRLTKLAEETGLQQQITATSWDRNDGLPTNEVDLVNVHYLHAGHGLRRAVPHTNSDRTGPSARWALAHMIEDTGR